jgi:hypothetical protein
MKAGILVTELEVEYIEITALADDLITLTARIAAQALRIAAFKQSLCS